MISCRYCAAVVSWSLAAMLRVCTWPDKIPSASCGSGGERRAHVLHRQAHAASAPGSTETRTAGCCPPPTVTCPTPDTCEIFCAQDGVRRVEQLGHRKRLGGQRTIMIGAVGGFALR